MNPINVVPWQPWLYLLILLDVFLIVLITRTGIMPRNFGGEL